MLDPVPSFRCAMVAAMMALGALGACTPLERESEDPLFEAWERRTAPIGGTVVSAAIDIGDGEDDHGTLEGGRTGGDWIVNGLSDPTISGVDPEHALDSPQGLGHEGWLAGGDAEGEKVIRYLVECALEAGDHVTVPGDQTKTFAGRLGLAPQWKTEACDQDCQKWVSACLLARTNEAGRSVDIFVQGGHANLGFGAEPEFSLYEATFFGNVFSDPPQMHVCRGDPRAVVVAALQGRTCALDESQCGFTVYPNCMNDAGCRVSVSGVATVECQPDPAGSVYHGIAVHVADGELDGELEDLLGDCDDDDCFADCDDDDDDDD